MEKIYALQKARFSYQPKLPESVKGNVADIVVKLVYHVKKFGHFAKKNGQITPQHVNNSATC